MVLLGRGQITNGEWVTLLLPTERSPTSFLSPSNLRSLDWIAIPTHFQGTHICVPWISSSIPDNLLDFHKTNFLLIRPRKRIACVH
jgi:hypothetical protein